MHPRFEGLVTNLAFVRGAPLLLLLVSPRVVPQLGGAPESPRTLVTGMKPPLLVSAQVLQQMKAPAEALLTHLAHKHLVCFGDLWCVWTLGILLFYGICGNRTAMS